MSVQGWAWAAGAVVYLAVVVWLFLDIVNFEGKTCGQDDGMPDPCEVPGD